jgi:hypothetical protein
VKLTLDLELDFAIDDHYELVGIMYVVVPDLSRWIDPEPAREAALAPVSFDSGPIHTDAYVATHRLLSTAARVPRSPHCLRLGIERRKEQSPIVLSLSLPCGSQHARCMLFFRERETGIDLS